MTAPLPDERLTVEEKEVARAWLYAHNGDEGGGLGGLWAMVERILAARLAARTPAPAACECEPCPGRGTDGHGMEHCAECCFGTRVIAEIDCPVHGERTPAPAPDRDTVLELAALGRRAQNDPGAFVPRIMEDRDGDYERLDRWQARAVDTAVDAWLAARPAPDLAERDRVAGRDLAALRRVAEAATPGPWEVYQTIHAEAWVCEKGRGMFGAVSRPATGRDDYGLANAEHVAAFDPPTVLALLDALAERDDLRERLHALADEWATEQAVADHADVCAVIVCATCEVHDRAVALRALLAQPSEGTEGGAS